MLKNSPFEIIKKAVKSKSLTSVLKLSTGTGLSQMIMLLGYIVLTRLYDPSQFGTLAFIMATAAVFSPALSLRMEMTVLIEKRNKVSDLAIFGSVLIALALLVPIALILNMLFTFGNASYSDDVGLICLIAFAQNTILIADYFFNRNQRYTLMALVPVLNASFVIAGSIFFSTHESGLIYGVLCGFCVSGGVALYHMFPAILRGVKVFTMRRFVFWIKKNNPFIIFSTPAAFINSFAYNLPVFLIESWFGSYSLGLYSMMVKFLGAPVKLISQAINKVAIQIVTTAINNAEPILGTVKNIIKYASYLSAIIVVCIGLFVAFDGFSAMLGEKWNQINILSLYYLPAIGLGFVAKSASRFAIFRRNKLGLVFQCGLLVSVFLALFSSHLFGLTFLQAILVLSCTLATVFALQILLFLIISHQHDANLKTAP